MGHDGGSNFALVDFQRTDVIVGVLLHAKGRDELATAIQDKALTRGTSITLQHSRAAGSVAVLERNRPIAVKQVHLACMNFVPRLSKVLHFCEFGHAFALFVLDNVAQLLCQSLGYVLRSLFEFIITNAPGIQLYRRVFLR